MKSPRHALITGASSGFGWSMTADFLKRGWIVHATSRSGTLENTEDLNADEKSRLRIYKFDLTDSESRTKLIADLKRETDILHTLVNNAGFGLFGALEDLSEQQIRRQIEVNFIGTVMLTQSLLPFLRKSRGHIINFSSVLGFVGFPLTSLYCASKFALEGWSEAMKHELSRDGVRVTVVQPGAHRTKFGTNVEWGKSSFDETSSFSLASNNYRKLMEKMLARPNPSRPETVAARVVSIAESSRPPFRVRFGPDAHANYWLRRMLPLSVLLNLSDRLFRRILWIPAARV